MYLSCIAIYQCISTTDTTYAVKRVIKTNITLIVRHFSSWGNDLSRLCRRTLDDNFINFCNIYCLLIDLV